MNRLGFSPLERPQNGRVRAFVAIIAIIIITAIVIIITVAVAIVIVLWHWMSVWG